LVELVLNSRTVLARQAVYPALFAVVIFVIGFRFYTLASLDWSRSSYGGHMCTTISSFLLVEMGFHELFTWAGLKL
jgi:hypothetical protein